jgi:hypothetical protein
MIDIKKESDKKKRKRGIKLKWEKKELKWENCTWRTVMMMTGIEGF